MDSEIKHTKRKFGRAIPGLTGLAFAAMLLWCCTPGLLPPAESDAASAKARWNDASLAQLNEGYSLYKGKCGSCHYLYRPDKFSNEKWTHEIFEMSKKITLDSSQVSLITRYILTAKATNSFAKK